MHSIMFCDIPTKQRENSIRVHVWPHVAMSLIFSVNLNWFCYWFVLVRYSVRPTFDDVLTLHKDVTKFRGRLKVPHVDQ